MPCFEPLLDPFNLDRGGFEYRCITLEFPLPLRHPQSPAQVSWRSLAIGTRQRSLGQPAFYSALIGWEKDKLANPIVKIM
eukprot:1747143-Pyramimonas_sp.AAC.1